MDGLVRLIVGESPSTQLGAVAVNRAGPATAADAIASGLGELLKSYAVAWICLRERRRDSSRAVPRTCQPRSV